MLYVMNAPIQAVQPENPALEEKKHSTEITNATKNISSNIQF